MPKQFQWFWGSEVNYIAKRNLEANHGEFRSGQAFLTGSFGITDWLCFDGAAGQGFVKYTPPDIQEIDYDSAFAGKYGFRIRLYGDEGSFLRSVFGFQHISVHPRHESINNVKRKIIFDDWQFSLLVSCEKIEKFTPYIGAKVSRGDLIEWFDDNRERRKSEDAEFIGLVCGFNFFITQNLWLTFEGRYFDEKAASVGATYSF